MMKQITDIEIENVMDILQDLNSTCLWLFLYFLYLKINDSRHISKKFMLLDTKKKKKKKKNTL